MAPPGPLVEDDRTAADWGVAMHAAKAGDPDATEPFLTWMAEKRTELWPDRLGEHEVSVSYNCRTGEHEVFRGSQAERDKWTASRGPDCITGSTDWWGHLPTGEPWIDDLKTGWKQPEVITPQTLLYTLVRAREVGPEWTTARISVTHWPRAKEPTEPIRHWRQVTDTVLLAFEGELRQAWVRAVGLNPEPRPGAHCLYCPSASVCPRANE